MATLEDEPTRLDNEIELLTAIYPDQATYSPKGRELRFTQDNAILHLRIPDTYPEQGLPDVLGATDSAKLDIRTETKSAISALNLPEGEEALDAIISAFQQVISERLETSSIASAGSVKSSKSATDSNVNPHAKKTVIIWLHHLLNTNKRKLCLSPAFSGITKPGYPGVLVYSGPAEAVRFEEDVEWRFAHEGVKEVESMGEVVKLLEVGRGDSGGRSAKGKEVLDAQGQRQKEQFLKAVGIK
ncbi:hypothetical protein N0V91_000297 [Didymella pomorum]|uniref:RWD domain-containing protein n=1 Tax=Didymella pomorum TaxID=749634 RepID=A0A9W9DC90_9PLEO|nr:hypothetical protein N0V91_000297 [Didymella pomorum]